MAIGETVLEMHYHRPLMELFRETYGVGSTGKVNFYKYSPQREVFIGFDQAFAITELSDAQFFEQLKSSAMDNGYKLSSKFVAYFLQFKVVTPLQKRQKKTPPQIKSKVHYRASLDTTKNDQTGYSQHELLFNLNKNDGAMVYYACPMVFDKSQLYEINVDLDALRLVDLTTCPGAFADNSKHYIYFDGPDSQPVWCSEPIEGSAITASEFVRDVLARLGQQSIENSGRRIVELLTSLKSFGFGEKDSRSNDDGKENQLSVLADSLMIVRLDERVDSD